MKRRTGMLVAALVCLLLLLSAASALAQVSMEASAGYDRTIFGGRWFPLEVRLTNADSTFDGVLSVDLMLNSEDYDRYEYPISLEAGEEAIVRFPIRVLTPQRTFEVILRTAEGEQIACAEATAVEIVDREVYLIGVLGGSEALTDSLNSRNRADVLGRQEELVAVSVDAAIAGMSQKEMDAFQAMVIDAYDVGTLDETRQAMLARWILEGGAVILGPGSESQNSAGWFEGLTGVRRGVQAEATGLISALLAYTGAAAGEEGEVSEVYPLTAGTAGQVFGEEGQCWLAQSGYGEGVILTCGFSLSGKQVLNSAGRNALWQRLLITADADLYNRAFSSYGGTNYQYDSAICEQLLVSEGVSILPVVLVLAVYVLIAGTLLYIVLRRLDRSKLMWICLPAVSLGGMLLVMSLGGVLGLNRPTAASLHVTYYDEFGQVYSEERALVAYPDQTRVRISAEEADDIAQAEYSSYSGWTQEGEIKTLRSALTLGDQPSIEMKATAPWLAQNVVMHHADADPDGSVTAKAWMEADGLHATIVNGTNVDLCGAVMLTSIGYVSVGDIPAGETREAVLVHPEEIQRTKSGDQAILEGELLEYPASLSEVITASIYPQAQTDANFTESQLDEAEQRACLLKRIKLSLASSGIGSYSDFACMLYADSPDIACMTLYKDGEPITRSAQVSVLAAGMAFDTVSDSGHFYYPEGTVDACSAKLTDEGFVMGEKVTQGYQDVKDGLIFGFDLSSIADEQIVSVKIQGEYGGNDLLNLQVYDWVACDWVGLRRSDQVSISDALVARVLDDEGRLFLRYTSGNGYAGVYVPRITVEGGKEG